MQGPTYALCYTTIVAYASAVSPPGTSATVQGIVAGMDDGLGKFLDIKHFITRVYINNINVFFLDQSTFIFTEILQYLQVLHSAV